MSESQMVKRNILIVSPFGVRSSFVVDAIRRRQEAILEDLYRSGEQTGTAEITQLEELRTRVIPSRMTVEHDLLMRVAYTNTIAPILEDSFIPELDSDGFPSEFRDYVLNSCTECGEWHNPNEEVVKPKIIYVDNRYPIQNWDEIIREAVKADPNIHVIQLDPFYERSDISFKGILANPDRVRSAMKIKKLRESKARINFEESRPELVERDVSAEIVRIDKAIDSAVKDELLGDPRSKSRYSLITVHSVWDWWENVADALVAVMSGRTKNAAIVYRARKYRKRKASGTGKKPAKRGGKK